MCAGPRNLSDRKMSTPSSTESAPVVIVGAGMAGLSCAVHLHKAGVPVRVFEAEDQVGGRVRTYVYRGFLLDRGFQVYLNAYPTIGSLLNLDALDLKKFEPGALVFKEAKLHRLMDVFRRPGSALESALAPVGGLLDKLRVARMRQRILGSSLDEIANRPDFTTEAYLKAEGFSAGMIDIFFRSFYGGIFLERDLRTSSRMFEFTFKMFGRGSATIPAKGMGEIPKQLAAMLPDGTIELGQGVGGTGPGYVSLLSGQRVEASKVVVAGNATCAKRLVPSMLLPEPHWRSVTNLYFAAAKSPVSEPIICLNGSGEGLVNNVCCMTDASPEYSVDGRALMSVSVLGLQEEKGLVESVQSELRDWFGDEVRDWEHLRTDRIEKALPEQLPATGRDENVQGYLERQGIYVCGDHCVTASIEGAVVSGKRVAESIIALKSSSG